MADKKDDSAKEKEAKTTKDVDAEKQVDPKVAEAETKAKEQEETDTSEKDDSASEPTFKKRFTQFKGETPEEYLKELEAAYANSSTEFNKLKEAQSKEATQTLVPEEDDETPAEDNQPVAPELVYAKQKWEADQQSEYETFVEQHPEIDTDPQVREKVLAELQVLATAERLRGGVLTMGVGLRRAWNNLNDSSDEETAQAAKAAAASGRASTSTRSKAESPEVSKAELRSARKLIDPNNEMSEAQLIKELAAYKK